MKRFKVTLTVTDNVFPHLDKHHVARFIENIQRNLNIFSIVKIVGVQIEEAPLNPDVTANDQER